MLFFAAAASFLPARAAGIARHDDPQAPGIPHSWQERIRESVQLSEYNLSRHEGKSRSSGGSVWQAPNRAHNFRTTFEPGGIRVEPRSESSGGWNWELRLIGYGRGEAIHPVPPANIISNGNRMEYRRGSITEWYVNAETGLEQGFTLKESPDTLGDRGYQEVRPEAVLEIEVRGSLNPGQAGGPGAIEFADESGLVHVRYSKLVVQDASGRILPSRMEFSWGEEVSFIRLLFNDKDAAYPIIVDPLATSPVWVKSGGQYDSRFGWDARTAGDVNGDGFDDVLVGAWGYDSGEENEGKTFLFYGSATGPSLTPDWTTEGDLEGGEYGEAVAAAGDVNGDGFADILIGSPHARNGTGEGRFVVYHGSAAGPEPAPALDIFADKDKAFLGWALATAGDVNGDGFADVIVSASNHTGNVSEEGLVWVFHGSPTGLSSTPDWERLGGQEAANFGIRVSTAGDVNGDGFADVIIGSHRWDGGHIDEGKADIFFGSSTGLSSTPDWTSEIDQHGASYGFSVGTAGDVNGDGYSDVAIGSFFWDNGEINEGGGFVFHGSATGPGNTPDWVGEINQHHAWFGFPITTAGDVNGDGYSDLITGAFQYHNGEVDEGGAWLYLGSAQGLALTPAWHGEGDQEGAKYGGSVGPAGDLNGDGYSDFIVGAFGHTDAVSNEGSTYIYYGGPDVPSRQPAWSVSGGRANARLGMALASAGDVNGDGFSDLIVGADGFDNGQMEEGKAMVYLGSADGLSMTPVWEFESNQEGARLGFAVGGAGDLNADGFADVIVGAPFFDGMMADQGRAWIFHGGPSGPDLNAVWSDEGRLPGVLYGSSVGSAGDVNGDGHSDFFAGAPGLNSEGTVAVYYGSPAGAARKPTWMAEGEHVGARFGISVAGAGDVNGDGYADLVVGSDRLMNGEKAEGKAYLYLGSATGLSRLSRWSAEGNQVRALFGISVAGAGDVDGDGLADVIIGSPLYNTTELRTGRAWLFHGSTSGLQQNASWVVDGVLVDDYIGSVVSSAGDLNGDGFADVLVGAALYNDPLSSLDWVGHARLYMGSETGLSMVPVWSITGDQAQAREGGRLASAGDVNGDGYADFVISAVTLDAPEFDSGRLKLFYGNGGAGFGFKTDQKTHDGARRLGPMSLISPDEGFIISTFAHSPLGRGDVKLEWEVKPLGVVFDGAGTGISSQWTDTGSSGVMLEAFVSGLAPGVPYHWRARLLFDSSVSPILKAGRWMSVPEQGWNQASLVTAGPPRHFNLHLDIRPKDPDNEIATGGLLRVAILGSSSLKISRIKARSLRFGPGQAAPAHRLRGAKLRRHRRDVNGDGIKDLVVHFRLGAAGLTTADVQACVTGVTRGGVGISACDTVRILP